MIRRMLLVLSVALVIAMLMAAMAMPAFAKVNCEGDFFGEGETCRGGQSFSQPGGINNGFVGGFGGRQFSQCDPEFVECTGESSGGGGSHSRF